MGVIWSSVLKKKLKTDLSSDEKVNRTWLFTWAIEEFFEGIVLQLETVDEGVKSAPDHSKYWEVAKNFEFILLSQPVMHHSF